MSNHYIKYLKKLKLSYAFYFLRSIQHEYLEKINTELESDVMIRAIHDVKGIDMGNSLIRYKAEVDFDGRELTRSYLDKQDLNKLLEVSNFSDIFLAKIK